MATTTQAQRRNPTGGPEMRTIRDVMTTQLVTVGKNDDLKHVMELMHKHNITKVPVVDNGNLVGIVTDNLIAKKLGSAHKRGTKPSGLHASSMMEKDFLVVHPDAPLADLLSEVGAPGVTMVPVLQGQRLVGVHTKADLLPLVHAQEPVSSIMRTQLHSVTPEDRLVHARRLLVDNDIARVPAIENGRVVGILHEAEIAQAFAWMLKDTPFEHQQQRARELKVGEWMRREVVTADPGIPIRNAARIMMEEHVGALPLVDSQGTIRGWVTRTDLIRTIRLNGSPA